MAERFHDPAPALLFQSACGYGFERTDGAIDDEVGLNHESPSRDTQCAE